MKKITPTEIDLLDKLPFREGRAAYLTRKYGDMWNLRRFDSPHTSNKNKDPYTIANRIATHNIGKPFDDAFSHYCTKVPKRHQHIFLEYFTERRYRYRRHNEWDINDEGLIIFTPYRWKYKKTTYILKSLDIEYKTYYVHKITGAKKEDLTVNEHRYDKDQYETISFIIKGEEFVFYSKDYRYQRKKADLDKQRASYNREYRKYLESLVYSFISQDEIKRKKDEALNRVKIISHGFDLTTSFRNDKKI